MSVFAFFALCDYGLHRGSALNMSTSTLQHVSHTLSMDKRRSQQQYTSPSRLGRSEGAHGPDQGER
jgi:hypothetical protein